MGEGGGRGGGGGGGAGAAHACKTEQDETTIRAKTKVHRARSDEERWWRSCWVCAMLCSSRLGAGGGVCAMRAYLWKRLELFLRCVGGRIASHQHGVQHICKCQQIMKWAHGIVVHGSWAVLRSRTLGCVSCACVPPVYAYGVMCGVCVGSGQHAAMGPRGEKTKCTHGRGEGFGKRECTSGIPPAWEQITTRVGGCDPLAVTQCVGAIGKTKERR